MAERVELTDLDVIARYSLAVRAATADRDELIAVLRADLAWLENGRRPAAAPRAAKTAAAPRAAKTAAAPRAARTPSIKRATPAKRVAKKTVSRRSR